MPAVEIHHRSTGERGQFGIQRRHGGGENGVFINHTHSSSADTFRYQRDCALGGKKVIFIRSENTPINEDLPSIDIPNLSEIITPYTQQALDEIKFEFEAYQEVFDAEIPESDWQIDDGAASWQMTRDEVDNSHPFPGNGYQQYMVYSRNFNPFSGDPQDTGGTFSESAIDSYKVPM